MHKGFRIILLVFVLLSIVYAGCSNAGQATGNGKKKRTAPVSRERVRNTTDLQLSPWIQEIKTVQLYRGSDESQLPIYWLNSREPLSLEFDLMSDVGRPLSVYFYHADRNWNRDLMPSEYLESFQRDEMLDFYTSHTTSLRYTHFRYQFPNDNIEFRLSGNFILRVTEQGMEDEVLFERPFFVAEQSTPIELGFENLLVGGQGFPSISPLVRFVPPSAEGGNIYDYNVCFIRNGQYEQARCANQPSLIMQPALQFYLEPNDAFEPASSEYYVDISNLRISNDVERTDFGTTPYSITLEPDYAQFPAGGIDPVLNGQIVVEKAASNVPDPDLSGEYAQVGFSFVPPEESPLVGDLVILGSFNGWYYDRSNRLEWIPERGRYEGILLLKQGEYEYRYVSNDRRLAAMQNSSPPRSSIQYAAFVYYTDLRLNTDRLIAFGASPVNF